MRYSKAVEIMMQLKAEYFYAFKDMPDDLFKLKIENFIKALEDYSEQEIDIALGFVLKENKSVPNTAHFIEVLERNRELTLPSAKEEWNNVVKVLSYIKSNRDLPDLNERIKLNNQAYNRLSDDVKSFYINYAVFLNLLELKRLDIEEAQFLKTFPEYRKRNKQREQFEKVVKS